MSQQREVNSPLDPPAGGRPRYRGGRVSQQREVNSPLDPPAGGGPQGRGGRCRSRRRLTHPWTLRLAADLRVEEDGVAAEGG